MQPPASKAAGTVTPQPQGKRQDQTRQDQERDQDRDQDQNEDQDDLDFLPRVDLYHLLLGPQASSYAPLQPPLGMQQIRVRKTLLHEAKKRPKKNHK